MIRQGFYIGNRDWWVMAYYNIEHDDIGEIADVLIASGARTDMVNDACDVLKSPNTGFTFSNLTDHASVICISAATSYDELFDTINHECFHVVQHICEFYDVSVKGETAARLMGELSKKMYKAVALAICPE